MTAIIIAAHNEASVIGRCIDALLAETNDQEFEIVVVANGCHDDTASVARDRDVLVIERQEAGKAAAMTNGDEVVQGFPRLYLDADLTMTAHEVRVLSRTLADDESLLACAPARTVELVGRPLLVRAYFAVQQHLPVFQEGLVGRGAVMLSERGRGRFREFPAETADDLFLDALFTPAERSIVTSVVCSIDAPYTTADLLRRLIRVRRGNFQLRRARLATSTTIGRAPDVRPGDRWAWLREVVAPRPWLAPAGCVYAVLTIVAEIQARRTRTVSSWGRDESTRRAAADQR